MEFTQADLDSAMAKLDACDLTEAETQAVAQTLKSNLLEEDEVSGFQMERPKKGFLLEVSGIMKPPSTNWSWGMSQSGTAHFSATGDLAARAKK